MTVPNHGMTVWVPLSALYAHLAPALHVLPAGLNVRSFSAAAGVQCQPRATRGAVRVEKNMNMLLKFESVRCVAAAAPTPRAHACRTPAASRQAAWPLPSGRRGDTGSERHGLAKLQPRMQSHVRPACRHIHRSSQASPACGGAVPATRHAYVRRTPSSFSFQLVRSSCSPGSTIASSAGSSCAAHAPDASTSVSTLWLHQQAGARGAGQCQGAGAALACTPAHAHAEHRWRVERQLASTRCRASNRPHLVLARGLALGWGAATVVISRRRSSGRPPTPLVFSQYSTTSPG